MRSSAPLALVVGWFLFLIHRDFRERFNVDDITNLCIAFLKGYGELIKGSILFWTGAIRPLGGLFYLAIYQFAGFWHLPFRFVTILFLVINLVLLYRIFRLLRPEVGFSVLALVLACYNADMSDMYTSTGTIYDTLCLTFTLLALLCVMRDKPRWLTATLCTVAAVDAKEMGTAIPAILLAYEWTIRAKPRYTTVLCTGAAAVVFTLSRVAFPNALSGLPAYQLKLTGQRYLETTGVYMNDLIFQGHLSNSAAVGLLALAFVLAAALQNRLMLFGWCFYTLALLPLSFATPRAGYAIYIPYAGAALYVAALIYDRRWHRYSAALAASAALLVAAYQHHQYRYLVAGNLGHPGGQETVRLVADGIGKLEPSMPKGAHLLLINDPFEDDAELPHSTLRLRYRDPNLSITRLKWQRQPGKISYPPDTYDHIFFFAGENVFELPKEPVEPGTPEFVSMRSQLADLSIVKDIAGRDGSSQRWVNQNPELLFRVPKSPSHFEMKFSVPQVILDQTRTLDVDAWIAGRPTPGMHITAAKEMTYTAPLPPQVRPGETVTVRFHVRNPYIAPRDGAKLAFLLTAAGFVPD